MCTAVSSPGAGAVRGGADWVALQALRIPIRTSSSVRPVAVRVLTPTASSHPRAGPRQLRTLVHLRYERHGERRSQQYGHDVATSSIADEEVLVDDRHPSLTDSPSLNLNSPVSAHVGGVDWLR
jgi:hypothetical protein